MDASGLITALSVLIAAIALLPEHKKIDFKLKSTKLSFKIPAIILSLSTIYFLFWDPLNKNGLTFGPKFIDGFDAKLSILAIFIFFAIWFFELFLTDINFSKEIKEKWLEEAYSLTTEGRYDILSNLLNIHKKQLESSLSETTIKEYPKISIKGTSEEKYLATVPKDQDFNSEITKLLSLPPILSYLTNRNPKLITSLISAITENSLIDEIIDSAFKSPGSFLYKGAIEGAKREFPAEWAVIECLIKSGAFSESDQLMKSSIDYLIENSEKINNHIEPISQEYLYHPIRISTNLHKLLYEKYLNQEITYRPDSANLFRTTQKIVQYSLINEEVTTSYFLINEALQAYGKLLRIKPQRHEFEDDLKAQLSKLLEEIVESSTLSNHIKFKMLIQIASASNSAVIQLPRNTKTKLLAIIRMKEKAHLDTREVIIIDQIKQHLHTI